MLPILDSDWTDVEAMQGGAILEPRGLLRDAQLTWSQALAQAEAVTFAGYSDWRVPNIKELSSLAEDCRIAPAINDALFPNTPSSSGSIFWSASPSAFGASSDNAWKVRFYLGGAFSQPRSYGDRSVRLVRGGQ